MLRKLKFWQFRPKLWKELTRCRVDLRVVLLKINPHEVSKFRGSGTIALRIITPGQLTPG